MRETNINVWLPLTRPKLGAWPTNQACALTGNRTSVPLVCRPALNPHHTATLGEPHSPWQYFMFFKKDFIYCLEEGKEGRDRETLMCERNINQVSLVHPQLGPWPSTQACALSGNRTGKLLVCRLMLNPLSHTSQGIFYVF